MKILNVDQFASVERQLVIKGQKYPIPEPTVQEFIDNLKTAEKLEKEAPAQEGDSIAASFEAALNTIRKAVPSLPEDVLSGLKLPAILAILQFLRGDLDPEIAQSVQQAGQEGAEEKKPS